MVKSYPSGTCIVRLFGANQRIANDDTPAYTPYEIKAYFNNRLTIQGPVHELDDDGLRKLALLMRQAAQEAYEVSKENENE